MVQINLSWTHRRAVSAGELYCATMPRAAARIRASASFAATHDIQRQGLTAGTSYSYRSRPATSTGREPFSNVLPRARFVGHSDYYVRALMLAHRPDQRQRRIHGRAAAGISRVVGWNNSTATVSSVTDTSTNLHSRCGPRSRAESRRSRFTTPRNCGCRCGANSVP